MWLKQHSRIHHVLEGVAHKTTLWVGSSWAFLFAFLMTLVWITTGPIFHFSDTWQLVMNTVSSVVTFLMVFLIQRSQNKDGLAIQVKLNELLAATKGASNRLINVEELSEEELAALHERFQKLADGAQNTKKGVAAPLSIEQTLHDIPA